MKDTRTMKCLLACLLAASMLLPTGSITLHAEEPVTEATAEETTEQEETISVEEETETFLCTAEEIMQYYTKVGEADGYTAYLRPEDYKDKITQQTARDYKDPEEAECAAKELEKHFKPVDLVLIDTEHSKMTAELEQIAKGKEETAYFSEAGRYLVYLNADQTRLRCICYRVSTLDSEYLFLNKEQDTLELYSTDYLSLRATLHEKEQTAEGISYASDDGLYNALLSKRKNQVYYCVRKYAENEKLCLFCDEDTALIGLMNRENGYIWWSTPLGANRDTRATPLIVSDLESSAVLTYGDSNSRGVTNLRSRKQSEITVKEHDDGITVTYAFIKAGITLPVRFELEDDHMTVSVKTADIRETKTDQGISATQLTLLGSFGAAAPDEEGYFVIPDGSGALIRFNNGKTATKAYSARVYGRDLTTVPTTKPPVTEKILMPVYGIVKQDNAMAVIVEKGDGNVTLNASVSGQSLSSYNICSFNYQLRGSDTYYMAGDYGTLTVFEQGPIKNEEIRVRYYPIAEEAADYVDIAETYRNYLLEEQGVQRKVQSDRTELYLDLYGGCMKARSVLGIPITMRTSVTGFDEARQIVNGLHDSGVDNMVVAYHNWTNEGITGKVDDLAKPSGTLGGSKAFDQLKSSLDAQGIAFYPSVNNKVFKSGNGYYTLLHTAIRISNAYSRQTDYTLSYGVQDTNRKSHSLLSPGTFTDIYSRLAVNYSSKELTGVSLGEMTSTLWGDYGKVGMCREDTMNALQASYQSIRDEDLSILAEGCAAYAFPYADRLSDVPLQSSGFDVFDEDIPFYQIVMHGVLPYSGTAVNAGADSDAVFLNCIATGSSPAFDMIYAQASDLKDTDLDKYFYSHYAFWTDTAVREYTIADEVLSRVSDKLITGYERTGDVSVTTYEDGTQITVDYAAGTITSGGQTWTLEKGGTGHAETD